MFLESSVNKVFLIGHIADDPFEQNFKDHQEVLCFQLVTRESIQKKGKNLELTEWHHIKVYKEVADSFAGKLAKGQLICLEGKIQTRSYLDEQQIKKYILEIIVARVAILTGA